MKHVKPFKIKKKKIMKYVIWGASEWEILKITSHEYDYDKNNIRYTCVSLYTYDKNNNILLKDEYIEESTFDEMSANKCIKFESNKLKDCIEIFPLIYDENKYNL